VNEPFGYRSGERYPLDRIARDFDAEQLRQKLTRVDAGDRVVHTDGGTVLGFDALLIAVGGRVAPAFEHVTTFYDAEADKLFHGVVQDVEEGYLKSICFLAPDRRAWPLPLYELALMTAERAYSMNVDDLELSLVTVEETPLAVFGRAASDAVADRLSQAGIRVFTYASPQVPAPGTVRVRPNGEEVRAARIVAMPRLSGPSIAGLPTGMRDFLPIDRYCLVPGTGGYIFAAGDATAFPIKHGGIGAQQADTAAEGIARLAGVDVEARPFHPRIRGMLLTGRTGPLYLSAAGLISGEGFDSAVSDEPLWDPAEKVSAEELTPYLAALASTG
jgi:sulfide:quinone oxidoreductase